MAHVMYACGGLPPVLRRPGPDGPPADAARHQTSRRRHRPPPSGAYEGTPPAGPAFATFRHATAHGSATEVTESGAGTPADAPTASVVFSRKTKRVDVLE